MVRVLFFASARESVGHAQEDFDVGGHSVGSIKTVLVERYPALAPVLARSRLAMGHHFVQHDDDTVPDGAVLAVIPPVAGG